MLNVPVPDYFQEAGEDALRARVQWLEEQVGLGNTFFARLLRTDEQSFARWRAQGAALPPGEQVGLQEVWDLMVHLLSFVNFDTARARRLLEHSTPPAAGGAPPREGPTWAGTSIRAYLEAHGRGGVDQVDRWVTSFRFGPPSLTPEPEAPCPSTQG